MIADDLMRLAPEALARMADRIDLCAGAPKSFSEARGTKSLGSVPTKLAAPREEADGWCVDIPAVDAGAVTKKGKATHWALTGDGRLLVVEAVDEPDDVRPGNKFALAASDVKFPKGRK